MPESSFNPSLDFSLDWVQSAAGFQQRSDVPRALNESTGVAQASVLIPLFRKADEWHVLFIRRVANPRDRHSGQVAFPGGRQDPEDLDEVATALREAHEEVGLDSRHINVIHVLPKYLTSSSFMVTPVVGIVPYPHEYQAQPSEVDRIFSIPLRWLATQSNVELRDKSITTEEHSANITVVYYHPYNSEVLWGASARMTLSLLQSLHTGELDLAPF